VLKCFSLAGLVGSKYNTQTVILRCGPLCCNGCTEFTDVGGFHISTADVLLPCPRWKTHHPEGRTSQIRAHFRHTARQRAGIAEEYPAQRICYPLGLCRSGLGRPARILRLHTLAGGILISRAVDSSAPSRPYRPLCPECARGLRVMTAENGSWGNISNRHLYEFVWQRSQTP